MSGSGGQPSVVTLTSIMCLALMFLVATESVHLNRWTQGQHGHVTFMVKDLTCARENVKMRHLEELLDKQSVSHIQVDQSDMLLAV